MKELYNKIVAWVKAHKLPSIVIASALGVVILLSILLPIVLGGNNQNSSSMDSSLSSDSASVEEELPEEYSYKVFVGSVANYGFKNVTVKLMDGDKEVASDTTNSQGYVTFSVEPAFYTVVTEGNIPAGYKAVEEEIVTLPLPQTDVDVFYMPQGVITSEEAPAGKVYSLGDVMYDFSITVDNNTTFTLSEVLKEKDMVLLNFWATWCAPCQAEFPAMNNAAIEYSDKVSVLAVSTTDDMAAVKNFKSTSGLTFNMANDSISIQNRFSFSGIPFSVIIDRYGVISFMHMGTMTAKSDFTSRFDKFCGDDYTPTIIKGTGEEVIDPEQPTVELVKPNVTAPSLSDVSKTLDGNSGKFDYRWQYNEDEPDEYSWPWLISEDKSYLYTPTSNMHLSYAALYINFTAKVGDTINFDYIINSEQGADYLYVMLDETLIHQYSGAFVNNWRSCLAYVFEEHEAGEHTLSLIYRKDQDMSAGDDIVKIKNLHFGNVNDLNTPSVNQNIFRHAATVLAPEGSDTKYENYVDVVLSDVDGYYHVGSEDGPILFASMMQSSQWSDYTLWDLAVNDYCVADGISYKASLEDFSWEATNNMVNYGYTPVTQELKNVLDMVAEFVKPQPGDPLFKAWKGEWHENEWLEFCCYYQHYGDTPQMEDPMKGITFHAAQPLKEGSNEINVPFAIKPRGFKYKFIPTQSGVYNIYSTGDKDTVVFLFNDQQEMVAEYNDVIGADSYTDANGTVLSDGNFNFHYYMEEGKTYYLLFTTFLDDPCSYNTEIKYVGKTYTEFINCATLPYSFNEVTMETYLEHAVDFEYADPAKTYTFYSRGETTSQKGDGYYHVKNADGTLGSIIYLDFDRPTYLFPQNSIYKTCIDASDYAAEKRAFYVNGVDYTEDLKDICFMATLTSEVSGFVAVDQELFEILSVIAGKDAHGLTDDAWLTLCYYYHDLGY